MARHFDTGCLLQLGLHRIKTVSKSDPFRMTSECSLPKAIEKTGRRAVGALHRVLARTGFCPKKPVSKLYQNPIHSTGSGYFLSEKQIPEAIEKANKGWTRWSPSARLGDNGLVETKTER